MIGHGLLGCHGFFYFCFVYVGAQAGVWQKM
jgi:hypothetical protein